MKSPDRAYILEITSTAEMWIRRCGKYPTGYRIDQVNLCVALSASDAVRDVHLDDKGWIRWHAGSLTFSAEPVRPESPDLPA